MSQIVRTARGQSMVSTRRRVVAGYSEGRQAYDRRRRRFKLDPDTRFFRRLVECDPCGNPHCPQTNRQIAADHIVPASDGGDNIWTNYGSLCRVCNAAKGNRSLLDWLLNGYRAA